MIGNGKAFSGFSVNDIDKAREFYTKTIGMKENFFEGGILSIESTDGTKVMIYLKDDHQSSTYTVLNIETDDILKSIEDLKGAGIKMEIYEGMNQDENGIGDAMGEGKIAWFKDPAGNILSVIQN